MVYDFNYSKPIKHFRFSVEITSALKFIALGQSVKISPTTKIKIEQLYFIKKIFIPIKILNVNTLIIDFSIGGPSLWGKNLMENLTKRDQKVIFCSFSRKEVIIDSKIIDVSKVLNTKLSFIVVVRFLYQSLKIGNCIVIGRDCAARMLDILKRKTTIIIETGYAERSLWNIKEYSNYEEKLIIKELVFRENAYPWDSFSSAYANSQSILRFKNIIWSEEVFKELYKKFPNADLYFYPPSIKIVPYSIKGKNSNETHSILVGLGNHQVGPNSFTFLNLAPLQNLYEINKDLLNITVVTKSPNELIKYFYSTRINVVEFTTQKDFFRLLKNHDIYYRVQNDSSIPISVIEAMARGCVCIVNERCKGTWEKLVDLENIIFVRYGDSESLNSKVKIIIDNRTILNQLSKNASRLIRNHCDIEKSIGSLIISS